MSKLRTLKLRVAVATYRADCHLVLIATLAVRTTWARLARVTVRFWRRNALWPLLTALEWITLKSIVALTRGHVVVNSAVGVITTYTRTRIATFVSHACFVGGTFRIGDTFRSTTWPRIPLIFSKAYASGRLVLCDTLSIRSTGWRVAWIDNSLWFWRFRWNQCARLEWISCVTNDALRNFLQKFG